MQRVYDIFICGSRRFPCPSLRHCIFLFCHTFSPNSGFAGFLQLDENMFVWCVLYSAINNISFFNKTLCKFYCFMNVRLYKENIKIQYLILVKTVLPPFVVINVYKILLFHVSVIINCVNKCYCC